MSEAAAETPSVFRARTAITLVLVGVIAFSAFITLLAYAPDLDRDARCRPNVYSKCAIGFAARVFVPPYWRGDTWSLKWPHSPL